MSESIRTEVSYMGKTIDETYGERELRDHILSAPDTFAGSIDPQVETVWCYSPGSEKIEKKEVTYIECFVKLFDEIIVNAVDQHRRIESMIDKNPDLNRVKKIKVTVDEKEGIISVENDGDGIDIAKNSKGKYIPELIFSDLLTSVNYDDDEKTVGGKNGLGAKIANIFSTEFTIETVDRVRKLKYSQTFRDNMSVVEKPKITKYSRVPYTKITYKPDFKRFGIKDPSVIDDWGLIYKRVVDASACTEKYLSVFLNGEKLPYKDFEDYISLYIGPKKETKRVFQKVSDRWEVGVCLSPDGSFEQVSFVNGICTDIGGRHVNHVIDNIAKKVVEKSTKKGGDIKPAFVKQNLMIFIKSVIVNPTFDTQTKRKMTSLVEKFGSRCNISEDFVSKIIRLGVLKRAEDLANFKAKQGLSKTTDGNSKAKKIRHPKLVEASNAGPNRKTVCTMVLTEGDSPTNLISGGIKALDAKERRTWGWFPLRGKLINIRQATIKQLADNEEIKMIKQILGLEEGKKYKSAKELRYDRLMIMSDNDIDGHHIKGLIMNFFSMKWPEILKFKGFICDMATPILRVIKTDSRNNVVSSKNFFTEASYERWMKENNDGKGWTSKYYKGLGTFDSNDARDLMREMRITSYTWDSELIDFNGKMVDKTSSLFEMLFSQGMEEQRKDWIKNYNEEDDDDYVPDVGLNDYSYVNFLNKRMILFSIADIHRSIPSIMDGLKPGQRKVLFSCFKKKQYKEIRVSQLAGYVSEHSSYHHGEASLIGTIVNMAQSYVGAGNINFLHPAGSFGTRNGGNVSFKKGGDAAAARYIHTYLTSASKAIFRKEDEPILKYLVDEGESIEPEYYLPVIPTILANGAQGIGTGWSSNVPCYNPLDIIDNMQKCIEGVEMNEMTPWFRGYKGTVKKIGEGKYITMGKWSQVGKDKILVEELPVGTNSCKSFKGYAAFLEGLIEDHKNPKKKSSIPVIDYENILVTDTDYSVEIKFEEGSLEKLLEKSSNYSFDKSMKLASIITTSNMHLFDKDGNITLYNDPRDIIEYFCGVRKQYYEDRRQYQLGQLKDQLLVCSARHRFISEIMDDVINIYRKPEEEVISILEPSYPKVKDSYDYLLSMQVRTFTKAKLEKLKSEIEKLEQDISGLESTTCQELWAQDISSVKDEWKLTMDEWNKYHEINCKKKRVPSVTKQRRARKN